MVAMKIIRLPASFICAIVLALACLVSVDRASARDHYELRTYRLKSEEKAKLFDETFGKAVVEAMEAAGVGPVGVFKPMEASDEDGAEVLRYVLVPYKTIDEWAGIGDKLRERGDIWENAREFLGAEKSDPAYSRIESSLLLAFEGMPEMKVPELPKDKAGRHFELRIYESHSLVKGFLKVEMFNKTEIDIFKKTGLKAVFFGQARVAPNLPQLTYMLVYDNEAERKKAWDTFRVHPDWKALKNEPRYKDTVSKIHRHLLVATPYSRIQ